MPLSMRFNHGTQQEYTEGGGCQMFVAHQGKFFYLSLCQLKLMMVREETAEAEGHVIISLSQVRCKIRYSPFPPLPDA